ncbi:MAG: hypothetical protein WBD20_26865 [Pirellulaceae bacterium]
MSDLNLLPHDPESFFALSHPYDRRDLKRAYGKAIRQYKPETHPREFQLVRDGYERLEKQLRYGRQQQQQAEAASAWTPLADENESEPAHAAATSRNAREPSSPVRKTELTIKQLAVVDPAAALEKLRAKKRLSPPDYYLAAVLADATEGKPTTKYLSHLIEGLAVFPNDPGLIALATDFIKSDVPDPIAAKVVQFIAKKLRSPLFYMLTESLWVRLVTNMPFDKFSDLLKACEQQIVQSDPGARVAFYLRLLRTAIWVAPLKWTDRILQGIESQSAELEYGAQNDLEFMTEIRQLMPFNSTMKNPVRKQLFDAVRLACQNDEAAEVAQITQILSDLGRDATAIEEAFPLSKTLDLPPDDLVWVSLVHRLVYQLESYMLEADEIESERIYAQTTHLLDDLGPTAGHVVAGVERAASRYKQWPLILWLTVGSIGGTLAIILPAFLLLDDTAGAVVCILGIVALFVGLLVSYYRWLFPKVLRPKMESQQHRWLMTAYAKHWRRRLFRFAQSNNETVHVHAARIEAIGGRIGKADLGNTVQYFLRQDVGFCIFAAIRTVVR